MKMAYIATQFKGPHGEVKVEYRETGPGAQAFTRVCESIGAPG